MRPIPSRGFDGRLWQMATLAVNVLDGRSFCGRLRVARSPYCREMAGRSGLVYAWVDCCELQVRTWVGMLLADWPSTHLLSTKCALLFGRQLSLD